MKMKRYIVLAIILALLPVFAFLSFTCPGDTQFTGTEVLTITELNPTTYGFKSLSGDKIEIGSRRHSPPQPYLNLSKWDGEVYLKVDVPYVEQEVPDFYDNRLMWSNDAYEVEFYPKEPEVIAEVIAGEEIRFRQNEEGGVEFDLVLKDKPATNVFSFPIETEGLKFYYQPPLHPEHPTWADTDGDGTPDVFTSEWVVGSYAVYHESKQGDYTQLGGKNYKTGKAFHIYRPKVYDAKRNEIWGELNIDEQRDILTVTVEQDWLNNAVYPVVIDPTFGYDSVGGAEAHTANEIAGSWFTCPENGIAKSLTIYVHPYYGTTYFKGAIYKKSDNSLVAQTEEKCFSSDYSARWETFNIIDSPSLSSNTDYYLVGWASDGTYCPMHFDCTEPNTGAGDFEDYGDWPDPWSPGWNWGPNCNRTFSIYCTYTTQPSSAPSTEASPTGDFTLQNAAPEVTDFSLYESDETSTTTQMTPQTEYAVKIDVEDANTLEDIVQIKVILKTNATAVTANDEATDKATYLWTPSGGWQGPSGSSTWAINSNACEQPSDFTSTSGTWWLHFTPGKVARESDAWDIYAKVTDKQSASDDMIEWGYEMLWYGELIAVDTSYEFGTVQLNAENVTITDSDGAINVTTIANGNYKLASKSANWINSGYEATLDWDAILTTGEFALKVDGSCSLDTFNYVRDTYTTITDFDSVPGPTAEDGDNRGIYQWLCVASEGLLPGTYNGTYYVQVANG